MNQGKVVDTLKKDYQNLFTQDLDYSIYEKEISVRDPSGIAFSGLSMYMNLFKLMRFFERSAFEYHKLQFKIAPAFDQTVRVTWHLEVMIKGSGKTKFFDGISLYHLNNDGWVKEHEIT